jgi:glucose/arabinose dehydrogenase
MTSPKLADPTRVRKSIPISYWPIAPMLLCALWAASVLILPCPAQALTQPKPETGALPQAPAGAAPGIGEPVPHVECAPGYSATLYARGLRAPDGLAFGPSGALYVVEEGADRVSRIEPDGTVTFVLGDLNSPEGIAFDDAGNLYVVEDVRSGRLIRRSPDGQVATLASDLRAPEDVVVAPGRGGGAAPTVYTTESNVQYVRNPYDLETGIAAVASPGSVTRVITHTPMLNGSTVAFWSYAGLTWGPDGRLYVTNELSGQEVTRQVELVPGRLTFEATLYTEDGVFAIDPARGTRTLVASGLLAPEGLTFSADGGFPLYVAEESTGSGGRLSRVERDGRRTTVCGGFRSVEDVVVDAHGDLYVSEDGGGNVIRVQVSQGAGDAPGTPPLASQPAATAAPREEPNSGSPGESLLRSLWGQLVALVRRIAGVFRPDEARDARPTGGAAPVQDRATPPLPNPPPQPGARIVVRNTGRQGLRCRAGPGLEAEIVGRLEDGTTAAVRDGPVQQDGYEWWQVEPPGREPCWVASNWLGPAND